MYFVILDSVLQPVPIFVLFSKYDSKKFMVPLTHHTAQNRKHFYKFTCCFFIRESEKRWCRSGHMSSCKVTTNMAFNGESLLISDDRKDTVTVTMKQVEMRDAGWYWCGAGEHQVSVQVLVNPRSSTSM